MGNTVPTVWNGIKKVIYNGYIYTVDIITTICHTVLPHCCTSDVMQISQIDNYIKNHSVITSVVQSTDSKIDDGWYFQDIVALHRKTEDLHQNSKVTWSYYSFSRNRIQILKELIMPVLNRSDLIQESEHIDIKYLNVVQFYQSGNLFNRESTIRQIRLPNNECTDEQRTLINQILDRHNHDRDQAINVLITGDPGTGKSVTARYLMHEFLKLDQNVVLVEKFNIIQAGFDFLRDVISKRADNGTTLIMLLDEFDISIKYAENNQDSVISDPMSYHHATNKQRLLDFIDSTKDTPNLITICTANSLIEDLKKNYYPYIRPGRFDLLETFIGQTTFSLALSL